MAGYHLNAHYWELCLRRALSGREPADIPVFAMPEQRVAYAVIPKAASTSIQTAMAPFFGVQPTKSEPIASAMRPHAIRSSHFAKDLAGPDWLIFAVVREPTARIQSAWRNKMDEPDEVFGPLRRMGMRRKLPFDQFVSRLARWPTWALNDHFSPQSELLKHVRDLPGFYAAKLESLADDWAHIQRLCLDRGIGLPDLDLMNRTSGAAPKVSPQTADILGNLYRADYEGFGYDRP
ncbi:sulfotransferase family 2 domain-containing protein [Aliiroseovarius sp. PTFE2010]|uniref:sulfotransferase family 2 domain-containing protein n=1 Tax=Aliiroseovarius sp. PTFE2010 TaxID=3417190 RepID=UPI003CFAFD21